MTKVMLLAITIIDSPKPGRLPVARSALLRFAV